MRWLGRAATRHKWTTDTWNPNCRVQTLETCYQQPDEDTMLAVVLGGAGLRERKA